MLENTKIMKAANNTCACTPNERNTLPPRPQKKENNILLRERTEKQ